jgi:serine/threonine-protein kinase HipA
MRSAEIYRNNIKAGILSESESGYTFTYDPDYYNDILKPAISLSIPKTKLSYTSHYLFPFFFNMLSEGTNRTLQSKQLKIDENDFFGLLLATAQIDTIGAITVKPIEK